MTIDGKMFLNQAEWVRLPQEQRNKLREVFNIPKSGNCISHTGPGGHDVLISDGTEPKDLLSSLSLEKILAYLGQTYEPKTTYNYNELFQIVLAKLFPEQYNKSQTNVLPPKESQAKGLADFPKTDKVNPPHITKVGETDTPPAPKTEKPKVEKPKRKYAKRRTKAA